MTTQASTQEEWLAINQSVLATALDRVRIQLARHADRVAGSPTNGSRQETAAAAQTASEKLRNLRENLSHSKSTIEILAAVFGLSTFELGTLLLCAGVELDAAFAGACAAA